MKNKRFDAEFDDFYNVCLAELKVRANYSEAFIPMLERYVTITAKLTKLNTEIIDEEVTVEHTNKAKATNTATSPKLRMFLMLNREANQLAKDLELSPSTSPAGNKNEKRKGFDLGGPMKIAK